MGMAWSSDFSYEYFRRILQASQLYFDCHLFSEAPQVLNTIGRPKLFLRHDVDIDLGRALQMAMIEKECGICSTYMLLLHSPLYNLKDKASSVIIKQLQFMGHEIGLHVDVKAELKNKSLTISSAEPGIYSDLMELEHIIRAPVSSISFHRPLSQLLHGPLIVAGRVNAYSKEMMAWYLSDSAGNWRDGEPLPRLSVPAGNLLQLLIHPIWWGDTHKSSADILEDFFITTTRGWPAERVDAFDTVLSQQLGIHRSGLKKTKEMTPLPEPGKFDTDATALIQRIEAHEKFGSNDVNTWIFEHLELEKGACVLDLGCGTGKQTIPLAGMVGDRGQVVAVDASQNALDALLQQARDAAIDHRIIVSCGFFDELNQCLDEQILFDRVLASFSLYYAKNPKLVFEVVHRRLKPEGIFFFCGPAKENNAELKRFLYSLTREQAVMESRSVLFLEEAAQLLVRQLFSDMEVYRFQNILQFHSAEALFQYWKSYNLYDQKIATAFKEAANRHFLIHSTFRTIKRVIGIKAIK